MKFYAKFDSVRIMGLPLEVGAWTEAIRAVRSSTQDSGLIGFSDDGFEISVSISIPAAFSVLLGPLWSFNRANRHFAAT